MFWVISPPPPVVWISKWRPDNVHVYRKYHNRCQAASSAIFCTFQNSQSISNMYKGKTTSVATLCHKPQFLMYIWYRFSPKRRSRGTCTTISHCDIQSSYWKGHLHRRQNHLIMRYLYWPAGQDLSYLQAGGDQCLRQLTICHIPWSVLRGNLWPRSLCGRECRRKLVARLSNAFRLKFKLTLLAKFTVPSRHFDNIHVDQRKR